jgi:D-alanyl-D-alanine carboxypeptidase
MLIESPPLTHERKRAAPAKRNRLIGAVALAATVAVGAVLTLRPATGVDSTDFTVVDRENDVATSAGGPLDLVPGVSAGAYAVLDVGTGEFLAARDLHGRHHVASLMKLLTAWVVMQAGEPDKSVTVPEMDIAADESAIGLREGEVQRRDVLLRSMLIASANDAARALAVDVGGSEHAFVERMNDAARELGLDDTHVDNPVGLDSDGQYSSAHDIVVLGEQLMRDPTFRATVQRQEARLHGDVFAATNDLLGSYDGADGIKTGHTDGAGWCVLASANRDGRHIIAIVLGARDERARDGDAAKLLDWAFLR